MVAKSKAVPPRVFSEQELQDAAREVVARAPGLAGGDFKKELPPDYKKVDKQVIEAANQLAARREIYRWSVAKKFRFFVRDPFDALAASVTEALAGGPLGESALKLRVETSHRGFGELLKDWLKGALARGDVYVHPPLPGSKLKRYGKQPDLGALLKKVLAELSKILLTPTGQRIPKPQLLEFLAATLELPLPRPTSPRESAQVQFLAQLAGLTVETKTSGLLAIRELRARLPFDKQQFDRTALELAQIDLVTLHEHDFPASLSTSELDELVVDSRGNHFVGIALTRTR